MLKSKENTEFTLRGFYGTFLLKVFSSLEHETSLFFLLPDFLECSPAVEFIIPLLISRAKKHGLITIDYTGT